MVNRHGHQVFHMGSRYYSLKKINLSGEDTLTTSQRRDQELQRLVAEERMSLHQRLRLYSNDLKFLYSRLSWA